MAKGTEREAINGQQDAARDARTTLMLARTRALSDLQHACAPVHRAMLEQKLADVDRLLKSLEI
jgi:hypothetical protein